MSNLLRFAEELLLGRAVSLQRCLLAMSSLRPRSLAQLSSRGPAQGILMTPLVGLVSSVNFGVNLGTERKLKKPLKKSKSDANSKVSWSLNGSH